MMNILRSLLVLSLSTFVLVGCSGDGATSGQAGDNTQGKVALEDTQEEESGDSSTDDGVADAAAQAVVAESEAESAESAESEAGSAESEAESANTNTAAVSDYDGGSEAQATAEATEAESTTKLAELAEAVDEEASKADSLSTLTPNLDYDFVIHNASHFSFTVNKMKVIPSFFSTTIPLFEPSYVVEKSIELGTGDCVRIKVADVKKISIRSTIQFAVSKEELDYANICSVGECVSGSIVLRAPSFSRAMFPHEIADYPIRNEDCNTSL